jgi:hypothetical protein
LLSRAGRLEAVSLCEETDALIDVFARRFSTTLAAVKRAEFATLVRVISPCWTPDPHRSK